MPEFSKTRIEHIPYGIEFGEPQPPLQFRSGATARVVYVGRLVEEQKRVSRLVELVRRLRTANAKVEFTFVGSGSAEAEMRRDLAGLDFVRFAGALPYEQVAATLLEHDVFILLSDYEGLPLSLLEAMGYGLVPVVSDLASGIRDVVDETRGFRIPMGDVQAATDALLALYRDRSKLRQRSVAAMSFVRENYNADLMAERYLRLVRAVAKETPPWPQDVAIPVPLAVKHSWLFRGMMRILRRYLKRVMG
jgi:glycosyltransferase involved in cell wall biosynthesis